MKIFYPDGLPISWHRDELVEGIRKNPVVIVVGETGSGKSTQLPKMIYEALAGKGTIVCTQPRRIAAVSIAARIAQECDVEPGTQVGHKIRFDDFTNQQTNIIVCTDGILLQEVKFDPLLSKYDVVFVDEAHERSLRIDFLLGLLKDIQRKRIAASRNMLKIVIASATLDTEKFVDFFETDRSIQAKQKKKIKDISKTKQTIPLFLVTGRTFPVDIFYTPRSSTESMFFEIAERVQEIHARGKQGDILVFLPGQQEILMTIEAIRNLGFPDVRCLPLFSKLSMAEQTAIFSPHPGIRHVIVATNIAETSITVPGITTVIDSGQARMTDFDTKTGIGSLTIQKISQASAIQRAGRAGRIEPGICYRLYSQEDFMSRAPHTKPEIQRSDLADIVLQMVLMGIPDIERFEFMDPPSFFGFQQAFQTLRTLGALDRDLKLTDLGYKMAYLPLDPRISRMLIAAKRYNCVEEIAVIASFLSVKDPFLRPFGDEEMADEERSYFQRQGVKINQKESFRNHGSHKQRTFGKYHEAGQRYCSDLLTYLAVWKKVFSMTDPVEQKQYCLTHYLNFQTLEETKAIYQQLIDTLLEFGGQEFKLYLEEKNSMLDPQNLLQPTRHFSHKGIIKSIASGLIQNLCQRNFQGSYRSQKADSIIIHPGSMFFSRHPMWIIPTEIIETTQLFARNVTEIDPGWLPEIAPGFSLEKRRFSDSPKKKTFQKRRHGWSARRRRR